MCVAGLVKFALGQHIKPLYYTGASTINKILDNYNVKYEDIIILGAGEGTQGNMETNVLADIAAALVWGELSAWVESWCRGFNIG